MIAMPIQASRQLRRTAIGPRGSRFARALALILLLTLSDHALFGGNAAVAAIARNAQITEAAPRQLITIPFSLHNRNRNELRLLPRLELPAGWRTALPEQEVVLSGGESTVRLVTLVVPADANAGEYRIRYDAGRAGRSEHLIRVAEAPSVDAEMIEVPDQVLPGQDYTARFQVRNSGNTSLRLTLGARSSLGHAVKLDVDSLRLAAGEARTVAVQVRPEAPLEPTRETIMLQVQVTDSALQTGASASTLLLPRSGQRTARFHTIPAELTTRAFAQTGPNGSSLDWQTELRANGALDKAGTDRIDILLRTPDSSSHGFGYSEEYRLRYIGRGVDAVVGDDVYSLSPLTEPGRHARGARIAFGGERLSFNGYYLNDEDYAGERQRALQAGLRTGRNGRLELNYLNRDSTDAQIFSLRHRQWWGNGPETDLELAASQNDAALAPAWRAMLADATTPVRYRLQLEYGAPEFGGYLKDQRSAAASFDYPFQAQWNLYGSYHRLQTNLEDNPLQVALEESRSMLGMGLRLHPRSRIAAELHDLHRHDRREQASFDTEEQFLRLNLSHQFNSVSVNVSTDLGVRNNVLQDDQQPLSRVAAIANWQATDKLRANVSAGRNKDGGNAAQNTVGVGAEYRASRNTRLNLNLQLGEHDGDLRWMQHGGIKHKLPNGHSVGATLRHRSDAAGAETDAMVAYTVPFGMPVRPLTDVSTVRGRVYDERSGQGMANVVVMVGNRMAVTNGSGDFSAPGVPHGQHSIYLDHSSVPMGMVAIRELPLELNTATGKKNSLAIALTEGATISGQVLIHRRQDDALLSQTLLDGQAPTPTVQEGLGNALIILRRGDVELRQLTDAKGRFHLAGVVPGQWTVTLADGNWPSGYRPGEDNQVLDVKAAGKGEVIFDIRPVQRSIRMLEPLKVGSER